jgi:hypothetical protein
MLLPILSFHQEMSNQIYVCCDVETTYLVCEIFGCDKVYNSIIVTNFVNSHSQLML